MHSPLATNRFHLLLDAGDPRALARQCTARSKQTGERCRNAARKGYLVCSFHGIGRPKTSTAKRTLNNRAATRAKQTIEHLTRATELHSDTRPTFRDSYAQRIHPKDHDRFLLILDQRIKGTLPPTEWRNAVDAFCR